jgi:hypothetical protein
MLFPVMQADSFLGFASDAHPPHRFKARIIQQFLVKHVQPKPSAGPPRIHVSFVTEEVGSSRLKDRLQVLPYSVAHRRGEPGPNRQNVNSEQRSRCLASLPCTGLALSSSTLSTLVQGIEDDRLSSKLSWLAVQLLVSADTGIRQ